MKILITQTSNTRKLSQQFESRLSTQDMDVQSIDLDKEVSYLLQQVSNQDVLIIFINNENIKNINRKQWDDLVDLYQNKALKVIPVLLDTSNWFYMPFSAVFPIFPKSKTPIDESQIDNALAEINNYLNGNEIAIPQKRVGEEPIVKEEKPTKKLSERVVVNPNAKNTFQIAQEAMIKEDWKLALSSFKEVLTFETDATRIKEIKKEVQHCETQLEANDWIDKGRKAYKNGDLEIALGYFKKAYAINKSDKIDRTIKKITSRQRREHVDAKIRKSNRTKIYAVLGTLLFAVGIVFLVRYLSRPKPITVSENVIEEGYPMILVKGKTFMMGSRQYHEDQEPVHEVTLDDFYIGKYEVTVELYDLYCQEQGLEFVKLSAGNTRGKRAMTHISWFNACKFANWLSKKDDYSAAYIIVNKNVIIDKKADGYRLPTEAQWEFAAIGGRERKKYKYSGGNYLNDVAWHGYNSEGNVRMVGQKKPNKLGIHDMSGNVWEWCWDWYSPEGYETHEPINPSGPEYGRERVMRGGSWFSEDYYLRPKTRVMDVPRTRDVDLGVRLVRPAKVTVD